MVVIEIKIIFRKILVTKIRAIRWVLYECLNVNIATSESNNISCMGAAKSLFPFNTLNYAKDVVVGQLSLFGPYDLAPNFVEKSVNYFSFLSIVV